FPEQAIETHLELAANHGGALKFNEPMLRWEPHGEGVRVFTEAGIYSGRRLLLCAGAWMNSLLPDLKLPLAVERQVLFWFEPPSEDKPFQPENCPIHIWEYAPQ